MAATILQTTPKTAEPLRGFAGINCLCCGGESSIRLFVSDVTTFQCHDCEAELTTDEVETTLAAWSKLVAWVRTAPVIEE
jgi:hypothetical protein